MEERPSTELLIVDKQPSSSSVLKAHIPISPGSNVANHTQSSLKLTESHINSTVTPVIPNSILTTEADESNSSHEYYETCKNYSLFCKESFLLKVSVV